MEVTDKINQLKSLKGEYMEKRVQVINAIVETIRSIGHNPAITPLTEHPKAFVIKFSALIDNPWSPSFHDWKTQADLLIGLLLTKPVENWISLIREWGDKKNGASQTAIVVDKVQLNKLFLQEVTGKF